MDVRELASRPRLVSVNSALQVDLYGQAAAETVSGRQIAGIKAKLQRMNPEEDQAAYGRVFGELVGLEQRRKWLLDRASGA